MRRLSRFSVRKVLINPDMRLFKRFEAKIAAIDAGTTQSNSQNQELWMLSSFATAFGDTRRRQPVDVPLEHRVVVVGEEVLAGCREFQRPVQFQAAQQVFS